jgi:hypothetical protein
MKTTILLLFVFLRFSTDVGEFNFLASYFIFKLVLATDLYKSVVLFGNGTTRFIKM